MDGLKKHQTSIKSVVLLTPHSSHSLQAEPNADQRGVLPAQAAHLPLPRLRGVGEEDGRQERDSGNNYYIFLLRMTIFRCSNPMVFRMK